MPASETKENSETKRSGRVSFRLSEEYIRNSRADCLVVMRRGGIALPGAIRRKLPGAAGSVPDLFHNTSRVDGTAPEITGTVSTDLISLSRQFPSASPGIKSRQT